MNTVSRIKTLFYIPLLLLMLIACGGETAPSDDPTEVVNTAVPENTATPEPTLPPSPTPEPTPVPTLTPEEEVDRAETLIDEENFEEAVVALETAVSLDPENATALALLGGVRIEFEQYEQGIEEINKAIELDPDLEIAYVNRCTLLGLSNGEGALEACEQAVEIAPENADAQNGLGITLFNQGNTEEAITYFNEALRLNPEHPWAINNIGYSYIQLEQYENAIEALLQAIEVKPDNAQAHGNLGLAYGYNGDYEESLAAYQEGLRLEPSFVNYNIEIGILYTELGQAGEAISAFETYLEQAPPNATNREAVEAEVVRLMGFYLVEQAEATPDVLDSTNPASVLQMVFYSAANSDFSNLTSLCDPLGENDGDTALICEVTADHEAAEDFDIFFSNGRIDGPVIINGDSAEIPFLFGADGDQEETMEFILRDGLWYLYQF